MRDANSPNRSFYRVVYASVKASDRFVSMGKNGDQDVLVTQAQSLPTDFKPQPHWHDFYEVAWFSSGQAQFISDDTVYPVRRGCVLFVAPGQVHTLQGDLSSVSSTVLSFRPSILAQHGLVPHRLVQLPFFCGAPPVVAFDPALEPIMDTLFDAAAERYSLGGEGHADILVAYLNVVLTEAARISPAPPQATSATHRLAQEFRLLLEQHLKSRLNVNAYAERLNVTPDYLIRALKQATGLTPRRWIDQRLAVEADRMLIYTDDPVSQVAYELGFETPTQFGHWFRRQRSTSPGRFRQSARRDLSHGTTPS